MAVRSSRYNAYDNDARVAKVTVRMIQSSRESELAQLFYLDDNEYWLPKSEITVADGSVTDKPYIKLVTMPEWLAKKRNLTDHAE